MTNIKLNFNYDSIQRVIGNQIGSKKVQINSIEERVIILILRDLLRLNWKISSNSNQVILTPPNVYDKQTIRDSMAIKRQEIISQKRIWIEKHIHIARENLANGEEVLTSEIQPEVEVCQTNKQMDLFRIFRYYWSSPYSDYVGRRIKLIIRDAGLPKRPVIGIAALGSSIVHIPDRDNWINWDTKHRTENLIYAMDAYILGALPPYNHLLGGKLISYIIASNEIRSIFHEKYKDKVTNISQRTANDLACIFTTSLYGKSSQYNRIKYKQRELFQHIGSTKGYGTLHLTNETFNAMRELLNKYGITVSHQFGDGPIWRMRVIRTAADILGFNPDTLLQHSFQRAIYAVPLAENFREFLQGKEKHLDYYNYPLEELVKHWRNRWFQNRINRPEIRAQVSQFQAADFTIE